MKTNFQTIILINLLALFSWSNIASAQRIAAGGWHSLVVCSDSTVKCFGENASGELGNATNIDQNIPVTAIGMSSVIAVSGGGDQLEAHSMALKSDGTVWAWGSNLYGGLGNGNTNNTNVPGQVLLLSDIVAIAAGGWHSVALKNNGSVWTWGWNTDGQLGDGTFNDKTIPGQVTGLSGVKAISAGTYHVLALKSDGTVWAWGDNISGQIGDGSNTDRAIPVQVSGLTDVVSIAAGRFFSLAVKSDGTVWTWGENLYGQLGNGTTTDSKIPVQVSGLTDVTTAVAATGAFHCMAVKNDNTVWAWGRNTYGNLGDGTVTPSSLPVKMLLIDNAAGVAAGTNFSLMYKNDGTFWGCGRNSSGQLGDGTVLQRNTPVQSSYVCPILLSGMNAYEHPRFADMLAFPNPSSNGRFNVQLTNFPDLLSKSRLEIYDWTGKMVYQTEMNFPDTQISVVVDLSEQADGIYFLRVSNGSQRISQKLIKQ